MTVHDPLAPITLRPGEMILIGTTVVTVCSLCRKLVRVNKWLFGDLHVCF